MRAPGRLTDPAQFEDVIVKRSADGSLVRVRDIGRAELGSESYGTASRYQGRDAVGFGVLQLPTANALQVYRDVNAEIARLSKRFPPGLKIEVAFDTTTVVAESIREVVTTLLEAIGLVVLVMFLFLQNWRTTLIPAITIPVSLIGTFAFVKLFGFSINTLTLFGITLATGLVVDDAIVVIENIERHIHDEHRPAAEAASVAMSEVTGAVIATALVLAAVFVPVAFFPGTTGRLYQQFALTIAISMVISAFNALTLTPALAALLLAHGEKPKGRFFSGVNRVIDGGTAILVSILRGLVRARIVVSLAFVGLLGADLLGLQPRADGVRARRGSGLHLHPDPGAAGRLARLHQGHRQAGRGRDEAGARDEPDVRGGRVQLRGRGAEPGHRVRPAQGLRGAGRRRALRPGGGRPVVRRDSARSRARW